MYTETITGTGTYGIMTTCKYRLPCGYCELKKKICKVDNPITITPTIDAVPVIRCENCKYSRNPNNLHFYCMCSMWERPVEKKGFCWLAESEESKC